MSRPDTPRLNVADRLAAITAERPEAIALAAADGRGGFRTITLGELNADANLLARGMAAMGIGPGKRIALLVKPGIEFVTLVFALLRTGATMVLVDAGLGRKNIVRCLASTDPDGFVAIPIGQAMRVLKRREFPNAKLNVTVGPRRWFWGGETYKSVQRLGEASTPTTSVGGSPSTDSAIRNPQSAIAHTTATAPAAIAFTSGSTGPPKGVLYTHQTFVTQCDEIQREYDIRPGDIDLACFPLFGLFNVACGVTVVLPEMDFSRPASCDPKKLLAAANQWKVNQAFASPAVWDRLSQHCETTGESIPTLRKVLSCGAPVPAKVLRRTLACVHPEATMHTPYGATESLPVATIEAQEVLNETAAKTDEGAGVCVGRKFGSRQKAVGSRQSDGEPSTPVVGAFDFDWRIIRISDEPIATIEETEGLSQGEIGELIVRGPQVSVAYFSQGERPKKWYDSSTTLGASPRDNILNAYIRATHHNAASKITDGDTIWHRIGDVGYFDEQERFWYCGRKSQRVVTSEGTLYTECVEAIANTHPYQKTLGRSALVGVGERGSQEACLWFELAGPRPLRNDGPGQWVRLHPTLSSIKRVEYIFPFPTDIRHNSKIRREELAALAETSFADRAGS